MKKRDILLIIVAVLAVNILPILFFGTLAFFDSASKGFVVEKKEVVIQKGKAKITNLEKFYDKETKTFYITGEYKNNTDKKMNSLSIDVRIFDKDKNVLGDSSCYLSELSKNKTWKFKIAYEEIDASEAKDFEFYNIYYS